MAFYDLTKEQRVKQVELIRHDLLEELLRDDTTQSLAYFSDEDTYIRKTAYLAIGRIYKNNTHLQKKVLHLLDHFFAHHEFKVRQTSVNAAGEIGMQDFDSVERFFNKGLFDKHHSVRNAVIGSVKKMGEKNPQPVLAWARQYLHHPDKEIRREICHGIELRGRTHPQDILPLLKELQHDTTARVRNTLVHVLGQIAYKKNCLAKVIADLRHWENKELVKDAVEEIIDVHHRYRNFSMLTQQQARTFIKEHLIL